MVPANVGANDPGLVPPDEEELEKVTEETRQALEKLVQKKVSAAQPVKAAEKLAPAQYIRCVHVSINYCVVLCYLCVCVCGACGDKWFLLHQSIF